jgi:hypothetical protein
MGLGPRDLPASFAATTSEVANPHNESAARARPSDRGADVPIGRQIEFLVGTSNLRVTAPVPDPARSRLSARENRGQTTAATVMRFTVTCHSRGIDDRKYWRPLSGDVLRQG